MKFSIENFYIEKWNSLNFIAKKKIIEKELKYLCFTNNLEQPKINYKNLGYTDAKYDNVTNTITFNLNMINSVGIYENFSDIGIYVLSVIYHEFEHFKQNQSLIFSPEKLGVMQPIVEINTKDLSSDFLNNKIKASLYIKNNFNPYMQSVYVLQPNEYNAFKKSVEILKKYKSNNLNIDVIENANNFIRTNFYVNNPHEEISNALMNLYNNGALMCSEHIMDLVTRCAICSYSEKSDYGVDRTTIFLGKKYEEKVKNIQLQCEIQNELE